MACAASIGTVHPVPVEDARESPLRVDSKPETGKGDMVSINRPWGKLMVGFLIAKLDQMVQQALAGLERDDCELFASSEYSETRPCNQGRRLQVLFYFVEVCMLHTTMCCFLLVSPRFANGIPAKQGSAYPGASAIPGAPEVSSFAGGSARSWDLYNDLLRDFFTFSLSLMVMTPCSEVVLEECNFEVHRPLHTQEASLGCVGIGTAEVVEGLQQEADANSEARSLPVQERLGQTWNITERLGVLVRQDFVSDYSREI